MHFVVIWSLDFKKYIPPSLILEIILIVPHKITSIYGKNAIISIVWIIDGEISIYQPSSKSGYKPWSGINLSGEYYNSALVKRRMIPVLKNDAMKILFIIALVVRDFVSSPMLLISLIFTVRMIMFHTDIKMVTALPNNKFSK